MAKIFEIEHNGTIYEIEADDATTEGQAVVAFRKGMLGGSPGPANKFSTNGQRSEFPGRAPGTPDPEATSGSLYDSSFARTSTGRDQRFGGTPGPSMPTPPLASRAPADVNRGIEFVNDLNNPNPEHVTKPRMESRYLGGPIAGDAARAWSADATDRLKVPDYTRIGGEPIVPIAEKAQRPPSIPTDNPLGRAVRAEMEKPDVPFVDRRDRIQWAAPQNQDQTIAPLTAESVAHSISASGTRIAQGMPAMAGDALGLAASAADAIAPGAGRITKTKVWDKVSSAWKDADEILSDTVKGIENQPSLKASRERAASDPDRGVLDKALGISSRGYNPGDADPSFLAEQLSAQVPQMAAMYVAGASGNVKTFGKTGKAVAEFLGLATPMAMEAQETREEIKRYEQETGIQLDATEKRMMVLGRGIVGGSLERLGFDSAIGRAASRLTPKQLRMAQKIFGVAGAKVAEGTATETATESLQQIVGNAVLMPSGIKDPDQILEGVPESAFLGAAMGLILGSGSSAVSGEFSKDAQNKADLQAIYNELAKAKREAEAFEAKAALAVTPPVTPPVTPAEPPVEGVPPVVPPGPPPIAPEGPVGTPPGAVNATEPTGPAPAMGEPLLPLAAPLVQESVEPPAPSMLPPVEASDPVAPSVAPGAPVVAPEPAIAPVPEPQPVAAQQVTDPYMLPNGTPLVATLPDNSTQPVTYNGMAANGAAMVILPDGSATTVPPKALAHPDGRRLDANEPAKPVAAPNAQKPASKITDFKVGDVVAISDKIGSGMEVVGFEDAPNSKGVVVPHIIMKTVGGTLVSRTSAQAASPLQIAARAEALADLEKKRAEPEDAPVKTSPKAPPVAVEASSAPAGTVVAATPAPTLESTPEPILVENATEAQIEPSPAPRAAPIAKFKVGDLVEYGPIDNPSVGQIRSNDGDYFEIEGEDGTVVNKADIKLRPSRTVKEIAELRAAKESIAKPAEVTTPVVEAVPDKGTTVPKKGKPAKEKATKRTAHEDRLTEVSTKPRTVKVGDESVTLLTENTRGIEGRFTTVTMPDGTSVKIAKLDSATSLGLPGWHTLEKVGDRESGYIADTQKEAVETLVAMAREEKKRRERSISLIKENSSITENSPEIKEEKKSSSIEEDKRKLEIDEAQQKKSPAARPAIPAPGEGWYNAVPIAPGAPTGRGPVLAERKNSKGILSGRPLATAPAPDGAAPVAETAKVKTKPVKTTTPTLEDGILTNEHGVQLIPGAIVSYTKNDGSVDSGEIIGRGANGGIKLTVFDVDSGAERTVIVAESSIHATLMESRPVVNSTFDDDAEPITPVVKTVEPLEESPKKEAPKKSLAKNILQMMSDIAKGKANADIAKIMSNLSGKPSRTMPQNVAMFALDGARARTAILMHPIVKSDPTILAGLHTAMALDNDAKFIEFLEKSAPTLAGIAKTVAKSASMANVTNPAIAFFKPLVKGPVGNPKAIVAATYKPTAEGLQRRGLGGIANETMLGMYKGMKPGASGGSIGIVTGKSGEIMFGSLDDGFLLDVDMGNLAELIGEPHLQPGDIDRGVYALGKENAADVRAIIADTVKELRSYTDAHPIANVRIPGVKNLQTAVVSEDGVVNIADAGLVEHLVDRGASFRFSPNGDVVVATTGSGKTLKVIGRFEASAAPAGTFNGFLIPSKAVVASVREMLGEDTTNDIIDSPTLRDLDDKGVYRKISLEAKNFKIIKAKSSWTPAEAAAYDVFAGKDVKDKVSKQDVDKIIETFQAIYGDIEIQPIYDAAHAEELYEKGLVWENVVTTARDKGTGGLFSQADGRVFLFVENLNNDEVSPVRAIINTLVHESIGHYGIQRFLNDSAAFIDDYWKTNKDKILADAKFNEAYASYWERLPFVETGKIMDAATHARSVARVENGMFRKEIQDVHRAIAEDHMIAAMEKILAERVAGRLKDSPKWYQKIIAAIRDFINKALEGTTLAGKLGVTTGGGVRFVDVERLLNSAAWKEGRKSHLDVLKRVESLMAAKATGIELEDFPDLFGSSNDRFVHQRIFVRAVAEHKLSHFARTLLAMPKGRTDIEYGEIWDHLTDPKTGIDMATLEESGLLAWINEGLKNPRRTINSIDHVVSGIARNPKTVHTLLSSYDMGKRGASVNTRLVLDALSERGLFLGPDAKQADHSLLAKAKADSAAGVHEDTIQLETGWRKGRDGKWRYELSDKTATFTKAWGKLPEEMNGSTVMLGEAIRHDKLFEAYPELKYVEVTKTTAGEGFGGWFNGNLNRITITNETTDQMSTMLHELQHWVQLREGFAGGGTPETVLHSLPPETLANVRRDALARWQEVERAEQANVDRYKLVIDLWGKHRTLVEASRNADEEFNDYTGPKGTPKYIALSKAVTVADKALHDALWAKDPSENAPWRDIEHILQNSAVTRMSIQRKLEAREAALFVAKNRTKAIKDGSVKDLNKVIAQEGGLRELYMRIAGEIEARSVEKRMGLNDAERAARSVRLDEDRKPGQEIFVKTKDHGPDGPVQPSGSMEFAKKAQPIPETTPENAETHRRLDEANSIKDDTTFLDVIKERYDNIYQHMTQAFPRLYTTKRPQDAVVNNDLRLLNEATNYATALTGNVLRDITAGLTREQETQLGYILAIRDVVNQIKVDGEKSGVESVGALQFGIKSLDHALEVLKFEESLADDKIRAAIAKRQVFMKDFVEKLKEYGLLPENHKDAETYFRRQTLYYYDMSDAAARAWGAKRKLRPASFGGYKQRTGAGRQSINAETNDFRRRVHEFDARVANGWVPTPAETLQNTKLRKEISNRERDFNTNYRQSEFEHIAAGYHTMRAIDVLKSMRAHIDEGPILRMEARELNLVRAYGGSANMIKVNKLIEEAKSIGKGKTKAERNRKAEIMEELKQLDPLMEARNKMGRGIGMLGHSLKANGIPNNLPKRHHFIAEELVRKAMTKAELEEANDSDNFDSANYSWSEAEDGSLFELMKWLDANHPGKFAGIGLVYRAVADRQKAIKEAVEAEGESYETAETLAQATGSAPITAAEFAATGNIPTHNRERLVKFSPDDKHLMFHVMTVGDRILKVMLDKMENDGIEGLDKEAVAKMLKNAKPALAFGPLAEEWYIPANVKKQLDEYGSNKGSDKFNPATSMVSLWKTWKLHGPFSVAKYNVNNSFGDADAVLAAFPGAFKYVPEVIKDLRDYYGIMKLKKNFKMTDGIRDIESRVASGVASGGLSSSELADLDNEVMLANKEWNLKNPLKLAGQGIGHYFAMASKYSNARENILRIAVHRYLEDTVKKNGVLPKGASSSAELAMMEEGYKIAADRLVRLGKNKAAEALLADGKRARVDKVARELVGDYGNISAFGQWARRGPLPFVSWLEINAPRYGRLLRNAFSDPTLGSLGVARVAGVGVASGAARTLALGLRAHLLMLGVSLLNYFFFGDEEKEFGSSRNQLHLMLGHNEDGSIRSLRAQGAISDVYGWVGMEVPTDSIRRYRAGEVSAAGLFLYEPVKAMISKVINGVDPFSKGIFEGLMGVKLFPSAFKTGEGFERDRRYSREGITQGILNSIIGAPMPDIFRALNETPSRKKSALDYFITYRTDPREQAFWDTKDLVQGWVEKTGKGRNAGSGSPLTKPTSQALYNYRKAVQYGWPELADHWASKFLELGGKPMALTTSIRASGPLQGIPLHNRREFYESLNPDQKRSVDIASEWYDEQAEKLTGTMKARPEYRKGLQDEYRERKIQSMRPDYPKGIDKASTFIPGVPKTMRSQYLGIPEQR